MSINIVCISNCGNFVEAWNSGSKIWTVSRVSFGDFEAVRLAIDHLARWTGDTNPYLSPEVQKITKGDR